MIPYCRQIALSWLSVPVRYRVFGNVSSPSGRSYAWVKAVDR